MSTGSNHNHSNEDSANEQVEPLYVPCPQGGKHTMVGRGVGFVYINGGLVLDSGQTSQCSKCHIVIISWYNPFNPATDRLGDYGQQGWGEPVNPGTAMYTDRLWNNQDLSNMESYLW